MPKVLADYAEDLVAVLRVIIGAHVNEAPHLFLCYAAGISKRPRKRIHQLAEVAKRNKDTCPQTTDILTLGGD